MNHRAIVWSIAGSDSGGGAGIQADLHAMYQLGAYPCTVVAALTAQNSCEVLEVQYATSSMLQKQIDALEKDLPAKAIKIGMLGNQEVMQALIPFLQRYTGKVILDPVMVASSGANLLEPSAKQFLMEQLFPFATLITPNLNEVRAMLGDGDDIEIAAKKLLNYGCQSVLIKGGHGKSALSQDYWTDGKRSFWLNQHRHQHPHNHGSGCSLSSSIAALLAQDISLIDALVMSKAYVSRGIRLATGYGQGPGPVIHEGWPVSAEDFPWLTFDADSAFDRAAFPTCEEAIGFYPIIENIQQLKILLSSGVKHIQLRNKNPTEQLIAESIALAKQHQAFLWINDHWQLAIKYQAYGVHLGQSDLVDADISALKKAGIRLGISTHSYEELAHAHACCPSYIALGPIFETQTKQMPFAPQGVDRIREWCTLSNYPVVAIGGIKLHNVDKVLEKKPFGVAVITALTDYPLHEWPAQIQLWLARRYARHLVLAEIGALGQRKLGDARVLVIGAGGLGSPLLMYLAAAGIGHIGIVDHDSVSMSNLQRQILFDEDHLHQLKTSVAEKKLHALNQTTHIKTYPERLTEKNILAILSDYDVIADGSDNFPTRYLIMDACHQLKKPLIQASVFAFEGQCAVFTPDTACYRCLFPEPPLNQPNCNDAGVLGVVPGILGTLQANEIIKHILNIGDRLEGKLLTVDALKLKFSTYHIQRDPNCQLCGKNKTMEKLHSVQIISVAELKNKIDQSKHFILIDVREPYEFEAFSLSNSINIPLATLQSQLSQFDLNHEFVLVCAHGKRSLIAAQLMLQNGFQHVCSLENGLSSW